MKKLLALLVLSAYSTQAQITYTISPASNAVVYGGGTVSVNYTGTVILVNTNSGFISNSVPSNVVVGVQNFVVFTNSSLNARSGSFTLLGNNGTITQAGTPSGTASFAFTLTAVPANGGTQTGAGSFPSNTIVTATAFASSGFTFTNFTRAGTVVSATNGHAFALSNITLMVANYNALVTSNSWAFRLGSNGVDVGFSVAADAAGNSVVVGYYGGSVNFGGGVLTNAGGNDIFVAKYNPSGAFLWAQRFGGIGDDQAKGVALDPSNGNVAVCGYFNSPSISFGSTTLTQFQGKEGFVTYLSASTGVPIWAYPQQGKISSQFPDDFASDVSINPSNGDVWVTGQWQGFGDFGQRPDQNWIQSDGGTAHAFIARYAATGGVVSVSMVKGTGVDAGFGISCTASGVYVVGNANHSPDFITTNIPCASCGLAYNQWIAKWNTIGTNLWANFVTNSQNKSFGMTGVAVDTNGNAYAAGNIPTFAALYFGPTVVASNINGSSTVPFVTKVANATGIPIWTAAGSLTAGSAGFQSAAVDVSNNVIVCGSYTGSTAFQGTTFTSVSGSRDGFMLRLNAAGTLTSSISVGGASDDYAYDVSSDSSRNAFMTGYTFGGIFNGSSLTSAGSADIFLMKVAP